MADHVTTIKQAIVAGKHKAIEELVKAAIADGEDLQRLINDALISAMDVVGKRFGNGEIFVPEMLVSALAMKKGLELIKPLLKGDRASSGRIVIGTVKGDMHDIGKNLVTMMLEGAGFQVIDLGVNINVKTVIDKVQELNPQILCLSTLLTITMPEMQRVIEELESKGLRDKLKVIVGGAPVDQRFADEIGADGYGKDAVEAVALARRLVAAGQLTI
jgi:5-methyltetrahydrofolate--homocysteine methyltransferase